MFFKDPSSHCRSLEKVERLYFLFILRSLLALLLITGCGQQQDTKSKTQEPVKLEGEWQAIDFRDTIERTFLFYYNEADSRLKVAEAFQDIIQL